ncbi:amidohydrolase family protein [Flavobacteriales bacterium]|nr:amidohydrolase family protein [Flavobacteriales bacterium]
MRFLTADYLYPLNISPIKEGVLQLSDAGEVVKIFENINDVSNEKLEIFEGILCPGFVNAHCHLELSHLLGVAEIGEGFLDFITAIQQRNEYSNEEILEAIENAEKEMIHNGIVAVGDICNTTDTLFQKQKANLMYYNFIETFGVHENKVDAVFIKAIELRNEFRAADQKASIVPHAPYSVPPVLLNKINNAFDEKDELLTIHMQETKAENQLFENKKGDLFNWLNGMNATSSIWENRNKSTDILKELEDKRMLLVHNTFAKTKSISDNYYCTCPKANLYIEKTLPDYSIFDADKLCVGTDSLASNNSLSILEELNIIQENSNFDLNTLLKIACKNGANALGFEQLGTFEKGKIPGVNLIGNLDGVKVTAESFIQVI